MLKATNYNLKIRPRAGMLLSVLHLFAMLSIPLLLDKLLTGPEGHRPGQRAYSLPHRENFVQIVARMIEKHFLVML